MPNSMSSLILVASPRKAGNSSCIATSLAKWLEGRGANAEVIFACDYAVSPCIACDACLKAFTSKAERNAHKGLLDISPPFACPLTLKDDSAKLITKLVLAPALFIVSPIYFYHLPAHFKALIDRLQPFWRMQEYAFPALKSLPERPCYPVLIAGRKKGEKLFEGSILSLRHALKPLNFKLPEALTLRGLDAPDDFNLDANCVQSLEAYLQKNCSAFYATNKNC